MGSTLTKQELIARILKATKDINETTLRLLPMKDLWMIERALAIDRQRREEE